MGLGFRVAILGKLFYLLYIPIMVTQFKFLNSNPGCGDARAERLRRRIFESPVSSQLVGFDVETYGLGLYVWGFVGFAKSNSKHHMSCQAFNLRRQLPTKLRSISRGNIG